MLREEAEKPLKNFFHYSPVKTKTVMGRIIFFTAIVCAELSIATFFVLILNFFTARDDRLILRMLMIISVLILSGLFISFITAQLSHRKIRRNSRFTYIDIQEKAVILSLYGGEYRTGGERVIVRELYLMPFEEIKSIASEKNGQSIIVSGNFRHYSMNSENLGYHIKDGEVVFDRQWLNIGGFEKVGTVRIPHLFGNPKRVSASLTEGKKHYLEIPKPKPYVFKEADFIRRRAKPRTLPDELIYNRKW